MNGLIVVSCLFQMLTVPMCINMKSPSLCNSAKATHIFVFRVSLTITINLLINVKILNLSVEGLPQQNATQARELLGMACELHKGNQLLFGELVEG